MPLPIVCIIGRPNVGKSTLFNRVLRRRLAVVDPTPGVTRDRHYAIAEWAGRSFALVDTGGLIIQSDEEMQRHITTQAHLAIEEADVVVFLVDATAGVQPEDQEIARLILRSGTPAILAVNKIDDDRRDHDIYEFSRLGPFEPIGVSALVGRASGDLLDRIVEATDALETAETDVEGDERPIHLAIVGRPNVGKSSLVNRLLGDARMIVTPIPGTTRDSVDTPLTFGGRSFVLIDTAGLRKPARVRDQVEFYTALRSVKAIHRADVVCVLLDASQELSTQDFKIAEFAVEAGKGLFFGVNKWDLVEKDTDTAGTYVKNLQSRVRTLAWSPMVFLSALTGQRAAKTLPMAEAIAAERRRRIVTSELNETIMREIAAKPPPAIKGRFIQIKYATQSEGLPPTFVFFCNHPDLIAESYVRFVANRLRDRYGFEGVPLRVRFRKKSK
jgi:GTP-binding protein